MLNYRYQDAFLVMIYTKAEKAVMADGKYLVVK